MNEPTTIPAITPSERPLSVWVGEEVRDTMGVVINGLELDNIDDDDVVTIATEILDNKIISYTQYQEILISEYFIYVHT